MAVFKILQKMSVENRKTLRDLEEDLHSYGLKQNRLYDTTAITEETTKK